MTETRSKGTTKRKLTLAAFGFVYGAVLTLLGFAASGGGHSDLMLMLAIAPAGAGILLWPIFGFTIYDLRSAWSRRIFLLLMVFHYGAFLLYLYQNWESEIYWLPIASSSALFWLGLIFYVMGQLLLWKTFLMTNGLVDDYSAILLFDLFQAAQTQESFVEDAEMNNSGQKAD